MISLGRSRHRDDAGQVSLLIVGFVAILVLLIGVVVDASAAFLQRAGLNSLADAAALAATDGLQGDQVYLHGLGERAKIDPRRAAAYAGEYLAASGARETYPGIRSVVSVTNDTVNVHLSASLRLPIPIPGVGSRAQITADAASVVLVTP